MKRRLVFALLLLLPCQLFGAEEKPGSVEFVKEQTGDVITLSVKSNYVSEFTVTLEATLENMTPSRPVPFTVESAGRSSFVLVRFKRTDKTRRWRYEYQPYWQFGARRSTTSNDADYAMPFGPGGADRSMRPFANYIIIKHADGTFAEYVHLQKDGALVRMGDEVTVGQPIGLSGQTGFASKPHLHFDVFQAIDGKKKLSPAVSVEDEGRRLHRVHPRAIVSNL